MRGRPMNDQYYQAFTRAILSQLFVSGSRAQRVIQEINEENYQFKLEFRVKSAHAVAFRLEDVKAQAKYLNGGKRAAGKDNDCTIIDNGIFQIEVKETKRMGNTKASKQLIGGERWLKHLLYLVASEDETLKTQDPQQIYNLIIQRVGRGTLSRTQSRQVIRDGDNYRIRIGKNERRIDLTRVKNEITQGSSVVNDRRLFS